MKLEPYRPRPETLSLEIRTTDGRVVGTFVLNPPARLEIRGEIDPILDPAGGTRTAFAFSLTPAHLAALRDALRHLET